MTALPRLVPLPSKRRELVIETGPGWELTADIEDEPPQHNHFDYRDAPEDADDCPRCAYDTLRAEG